MTNHANSRRLGQAITAGFLEQKDKAMLECSVMAGSCVKGAWLSAPRDRAVPGSAVSNGKLTRQTGRGAKSKCLIARPD